MVFLRPCGLRCFGVNVYAVMVNSRANMLVKQKTNRSTIRALVITKRGSANVVKTSIVTVSEPY